MLIEEKQNVISCVFFFLLNLNNNLKIFLSLTRILWVFFYSLTIILCFFNLDILWYFFMETNSLILMFKKTTKK
jgi:hypothetical protein